MKALLLVQQTDSRSVHVHFLHDHLKSSRSAEHQLLIVINGELLLSGESTNVSAPLYTMEIDIFLFQITEITFV